MIDRKKRAVAVLFLAVMLVLLSSATAFAAVRLSSEKMELYVGASFKLKLKKNHKKIKWSSSKEKVAFIRYTEGNSAVIEARKAGKTVITAKAGKKKYQCVVTVPKPSYSLKVKKTTVTVMEGRAVAVKVKAKSKKAVVSVQAASDQVTTATAAVADSRVIITGKQAGETYVTVRYGSKSARIKVIVTDAPGKYKLSLDLQERITLVPEITADIKGPSRKYYFDISAKVNGRESYGMKGRPNPSISLEKISGPKLTGSRTSFVRLDASGRYRICVTVPNYYALMESFADSNGSLVYKYRIRLSAGADTKTRDLTVTIRDSDPASPAAQRFISTLFKMDALVREDIKNNKKWTYKNKRTRELARQFDDARKTGNRRTNCVTAVYWGLLRSGAVNSNRDGIQWYGNKGIRWLNPNAEADARKYFDIIEVGNKTVKKCISEGILKPGDIVTYKSMSHTNVYLGNGLSFDSGHANCSGKGENAEFIRWIGNTPYTGYKVASILRLKR